MKFARLSAVSVLLVWACCHHAMAQTLPQAVQSAVETHPQMLESDRKVREGEQVIQEAQGGYLPSVDVTADWGYQVVDNSTTRANGTDSDTWNNGRVGFEARQMLFDGFATGSDVERTEAFTQAREHQRQATAEAIALAAARVYLDVIRYRTQLQLALENLENHRVIYKQISSRVDRGVGTIADKSQIESRLNNAESNVIAAQNNVLDAESAYIQIVGESAPRDLLSFRFEERWLPSNKAQAHELVRKQNPVILASKADINEAESRYEYSKSSNYPELDLVLYGDYGDDIDGVNGSDTNYGAMVQMRWNLFRGGSDKANQKASAYVVEQARAINANAHREATQRIDLAWAAYEMLGKQQVFLERYVTASEKTRDAYKKEFNLGKRTLLDMLDSENELFGARNQYTDAQTEYEQAKARVLEAIGSLNRTLR
ncbi:TolC family outer membrane protein [Neiella marina]|uniref:TolC family outer membrane protein n=1 Tax=Neiella holothuriorum TaxID=2870530 RepID=A0ABS7EIL4_9GAMM|nr:TolC family outer membrane protein [Neiella holothuriorum]MBW8192065.1 TolC family outer membrane protein [Neiella holothuriorum]